MSHYISVLLPTYNPDSLILNRAVAALENQLLTVDQWELIIIDNNSCAPISVSLGWHPNAKIIKEPRQGLSFARLRGFMEATGDLIVMVDDDNLLEPDYLEIIVSQFRSNKRLGATGGKSIPLFEKTPPLWLRDFYGNLALRDLGSKEVLAEWSGSFPEAAPIGAGMGIRKAALKSYIEKAKTSNFLSSDRTGSSLSSGGDNDIILEILKSGWQISYTPTLLLTHIIPEARTKVNYVAKLLNNTNKSWVELLESHHINPWPKIQKWTVPLRKAKAWFTYRAYLNNSNFIKWRGACGIYDGLAN